MEAPYRQVETERITPDTHVIRQLWGEGVSPIAVFINSMVITGAEPVVVDTGTEISGKDWMNGSSRSSSPRMCVGSICHMKTTTTPATWSRCSIGAPTPRW